MKRILFLFFLATLLALVGCDPQSNKVIEDRPGLYFDLRSLVARQAAILDSLDAQVRKTVIDQGQEKTRLLKPGSWQAELAMFSQADINQGVFEGLYAESDSTTDQHYYKIYHATEEDLKTRYLRVKYDSSKEQVLALEVYVSRDNTLYSSHRKLMMTLSPHQTENGRSRMESYTIEGRQDTMFGTDLVYRVQGQLVY
ncbi:MAG: hypothetical protein HC880_22375 [Bacteroidia bacterium]|nr:hypothetical protein [Bacteroidia bacterium]